jgi:hypothetical protein
LTHISLDQASDSVKQFICSLPIDPAGVILELDGRVICKVVPPFEEAEKQVLIERGRKLVRRVRERNRGVPAQVIEREVREEVEEVRRNPVQWSQCLPCRPKSPAT